MALIDIIMPVRNGARFLPAAVASLQAQSLRDWRLLLLDHGSTDDTMAVAGRLAQADGRIALSQHADAVGVAGLRNVGLSLVQAPYVVMQDADDESLPDRLQRVARAFADDPQAMVIGGSALLIDAEGREFGRFEITTDPALLALQTLFRMPVVHPATALRSELMQRVRVRYGESLALDGCAGDGLVSPELVEDYQLMGELAVAGLVRNLPEPLLRYRFHGGGVSRARYTEQIRLSGLVSRHLARVVSQRAGCAAFDPAPFGSHGGTLLDLGVQADHREAWHQMRDALLHSDGPWRRQPELVQRELAWRSVYVDRQPLGLLGRALGHWASCRPDRHERQTVRNVVLKRLRRQPLPALQAAV
ncbi:MAG: hypothetical protein RLY78_1926 [Pseudomonadota bacterium]|jgi:hypothetical protein|uniref:Glycosyltransferase family 2 protein n=1 Tax=Pseudaquabacterium rugosum TaxID=2984194 RepID=A0ABU9BER2_9BURK